MLASEDLTFWRLTTKCLGEVTLLRIRSEELAK